MGPCNALAGDRVVPFPLLFAWAAVACWASGMQTFVMADCPFGPPRAALPFGWNVRAREGWALGVKQSGVDPPLCSSCTRLHMAFIANHFQRTELRALRRRAECALPSSRAGAGEWPCCSLSLVPPLALVRGRGVHAWSHVTSCVLCGCSCSLAGPTRHWAQGGGGVMGLGPI